MTLKKQLIHILYPFFMTFEHLNHVLILTTLSSLHINDLEEGCAYLQEILNGMNLKHMECPHME